MLLKNTPEDNPFSMACPNCGALGSFVKHGTYDRHLITTCGEETLSVVRLRCRSCGTTHAIIPPDVVPYKVYSESFILKVVLAWSRGLSLLRIMEIFHLPRTTLQRMLRHARARMGVLYACGTKRDLIAHIFAHNTFRDIAHKHMYDFRTRFTQHRRLNNLSRAPTFFLDAST